MISKVISEDKISAAKELIYEAQKIAIITHTSPDGDAMGSALGMFQFLKQLDKDATVVFPDDCPRGFEWMPGMDEVLIHRSHTEAAEAALEGADLIICQDFNSTKRVASAQPALERSKAKKLLLDHHLEPTSNFDVIIEYPEMAATCEVVFRLICRMGHAEDITEEVAACLYTGLMTDTGNFTYSSNDIELYYIVAELMKRGIDKEEIYRKVNNNGKESQMRLRGHLLKDNMRLYPEYHAAITTLDAKEKAEYSYEKGDTEGFVNEPMRIKDIQVSVFISQDKDKIKLSFRSMGDVPVNTVATKYFGGGGHKNAAGGEAYYISLEQVRKKVEEILPEIWNGRGESEK